MEALLYPGCGSGRRRVSLPRDLPTPYISHHYSPLIERAPEADHSPTCSPDPLPRAPVECRCLCHVSLHHLAITTNVAHLGCECPARLLWSGNRSRQCNEREDFRSLCPRTSGTDLPDHVDRDPTGPSPGHDHDQWWSDHALAVGDEFCLAFYTSTTA